MFVVFGVKHFASRPIAFRSDFCMSCEAPCRSIQVRTFDMLHVYWIPLIPLGFWRRWFCQTCGRRPHRVARTRRSYKIAGAIALALIALALWTVPAPPEDLVTIWCCRIGVIVGFVALVWSIARHRPLPALRRQLERIAPASDSSCPFCNRGLMVLSGTASCPGCGVRRV